MVRKLTILALLLPLLLLAAACNDSALQQARRALANISAGLSAGDRAVQTLYNAGAISADEARHVEGFIKQGTLLNDNLNGCVDLMKQAGTTQQAILCANNIVSQFKAQEAQAIIGIKNPEAQAKMNIALQLVDTGVLLLESALQQLGGGK